MIKFLVIGDFHYKKGMFTTSLHHLEKQLQRAHDEQVDFVIHTGDFSNDYTHSPEILRAYHQNSYGLPTYGVMGNHELEKEGNSMETVPPLLCHAPVTFGTSEDGPVGYWYGDIKNYRLIGLDTNHSYTPVEHKCMHNLAASYGPPVENTGEDSLGATQIAWLEEKIADAAKQEKKVIVISHASFMPPHNPSPDSDIVHAIFAKYPKTVLLAINGHNHTDNFDVFENVAYFDVNTTICGHWQLQKVVHYTSEHTFPFTDYDENGLPIGTTDVSLADLRQGSNIWFFQDPLSAIVTITDDGEITIQGSKTDWAFGIAPPITAEDTRPRISDHKVKLKI